MDRIAGGFDPNVGIMALRDGRREIGRVNLPASSRLIPDAELSRTDALLFGRLSDSALLERFAAYLGVEPRFRELLAPAAFFEALESASREFADEAGKEGGKEEGPLVAAARRLSEILSDKDLCDALRNLIMKA